MDQINKEDIISRQAAIDAIDKYSVWVMYTQGDSQNDEAEFVENIIKQTKKAIQSMLREELSSAQPENDWIPVTKKRILICLSECKCRWITDGSSRHITKKASGYLFLIAAHHYGINGSKRGVNCQTHTQKGRENESEKLQKLYASGF